MSIESNGFVSVIAFIVVCVGMGVPFCALLYIAMTAIADADERRAERRRTRKVQ